MLQRCGAEICGMSPRSLQAKLDDYHFTVAAFRKNTKEEPGSAGAGRIRVDWPPVSGAASARRVFCTRRAGAAPLADRLLFRIVYTTGAVFADIVPRPVI